MAKHANPSVPTVDYGAVPWLLAVALATAAPHAGHLPPWLTLLSALTLLWRLRLWQTHAALPPRWLLATLVVAGSASIAWEYRTLLGRDAGVALLFFFMALKPMEMHRHRDATVIIMLGFFLLLTHYFFSQGIPTGLWLLGSTVLLAATLIRLHGGPQPIGRLLRYAGTLLLQAIPFMIALFLLFPRIQGPLWGLPRDAHAGLSGLSDHMAPGSLNHLIQSGAIAFRVQFAGGIPHKNRLYWRGPVLVDYDGRTWRTPPSFLRGSAQTLSGLEPEAPVIRYAITLEPHNQRWLLALDMPTRIPENVAISPLFETRSRTPLTQRSRYVFESVTEFSINREEAPDVLQQALRLPAGLNPQAHALAESWRTRLNNPETISAAALQLFREEAFHYTLQPPLLGTHAIDDFLFVSRKGFCEHFAAAYVVLMRAAGIPARVVTGYQGGEINPVDGYLTVRQSDAHAWAEIWIAGKGWRRIDPTAAVAPSRVEQGISAALTETDALPALIRLDNDWLRAMLFRWEALNNAWNQWIIGYNPIRQRELLSRLGLGEPDWREMIAVLSALCGISLLAVTAWTLYHRRRLTPAQRLWQRCCQRLARFGIEKSPWEGPLAFAERVASECPALALLIREAARQYANLEYGDEGQERIENLAASVRRIERWHKEQGE